MGGLVTYNVLVTETQTCLLSFDTKEEALAVSERINGVLELEDSEFDEHMEWMYNIIPGWDVETIAEVIEE
jgi:hypothetical protein